jgi:membrane protease subunit HflK
MSENEPGSNKDKDIWSKGPKREEGPPDLDELVNKLQRKINSFFVSKIGRKRIKRVPFGSKAPKILTFRSILLVLLVAIIIWIAFGIFIVSPAERVAVLRFGKYNKTVGPGPHWILRFIESRYVINVQRVSTFPYQAEMLTKDENIVSVSVAVQYRIDNVRDYLFNVVDPVVSLQQATASALRQVVGHTTLDEILTTGRELVREQMLQQLTRILDNYHSGVVVTDIALQPAKPPEAVTEAFDDVNKAREDEQRYINEAKAYQQKVVPIAEGHATRILREAEAYQKKVILQAQADTAQYLALLPQYERAPGVTRERLYLSTIEEVLRNSSKILVDVKNANMMYLPLDKLFSRTIKPQELPEFAEASVSEPKLTDTAKPVQSDSERPNRVGYSGQGEDQ